MTLAAACLGAGATMAAGALILGLGSAPAFAQQAGLRPAATGAIGGATPAMPRRASATAYST
jgi:hypothetical protein